VSIGGEPVGSNRLNGIAVSVDAQHIWLTVSGALPGYANSPGALIEIPAFGPGRAAETSPPPAEQKELVPLGAALFEASFSIEEGLGPLYTEKSCKACHSSPRLGGMGPEGLGLHMRVGKMVNGSYDPLHGRGGPVARSHSIAELGVNCRLVAGMPAEADVVSLRNAPSLFGAGLIDSIPDAIILAAATAERSGGTTVSGRAHIVAGADGDWHVGRFGWKADTASLRQVVANSLRNEIGITNPLAPSDLVATAPGCGVRHTPTTKNGSQRVVRFRLDACPARCPHCRPSAGGRGAFHRDGLRLLPYPGPSGRARHGAALLGPAATRYGVGPR